MSPQKVFSRLLTAFLVSSLAALAQTVPPGSKLILDESKLSRPEFKVRMEHHVPVKMRDGVNLSTDIYLPDAPGPFPVILTRTPYSNNSAGGVEAGKWWAARGYGYVTQDVRGKYDSGGQYTLFRDEANDGSDTLAWIASRPWCNGKIGTTGGSYGGYVQIAAAVSGTPHLTAMAASVTTGDIFNNWMYVDGALFLSFALGWGGVDMDGHVMQYGPAYDWPAVYRHLPLANIGQAASHANPGFHEILKHPRANDPFWRGISFEKEIAAVSVPFLVVEGWYDIFLCGALKDDMLIRKSGKTATARKNKHLLIGPWTHVTGVRNNHPGKPAGGPDRGIDFGEQAEMNMRLYYLRWHDRWLKGVDNGADREPPVKIFVMGENVWRFEEEWPLARTRYTSYYLGSGGRAGTAAGDGILSVAAPGGGAEIDHFTYDPADPVPTIGGNLLDCLGCNSVSAGPLNQQAVEARPDVLVYTTPVLTAPLEVTGPLTVKLYASTSAPDTDWTAKLVDVHPDGYAQNLQDGIIRARYRQGRNAPAALLEPGKVYEYEIDLWATSNAFGPGHRIRLEISSSNFPRFDRNLNTGEDPVTGTRLEVARQTVYHSAQYPSRIILPVIPRPPAEKGN